MAARELRIKLSHQDLANFIGSTRETVTVVLGKMQLDGLLIAHECICGKAQRSEIARRQGELEFA